MTQEEKLQEAKRLYETANSDQRYVLESLFPELIESEDERTRKEIIELVWQPTWKTEKEFNRRKELIAWLKKQGKQETDGWKEGDIIRHGGILALVIKGRRAMKSNGELFTVQYPNECVKAAPNEIKCFLNELEKQGEHKINDIYPIFRVGDYIRNKKTSDKVLIEQLDIATKAYCYVSYDGAAVNHSDFPFVKQDEWELIGQKVVEQKSAWSEEDEKHRLNCLSYFNMIEKTSPYYEDYLWLKSLRPQNQNTTSKEHEDTIRKIKTYIAQCNGFNRKHRDEVFCLLDSLRPQNVWKKSLKTVDLENELADIQNGFSNYSKEYKVLGEAIECIRCHDSWKPSDEQIKVCKEVYADLLSAKGFDLSTVNSELNRMEEQLKKLTK